MSLGIAVIGTGRMGADHVRRIDSVIGGARVAAVADLDADRAREAAAGIEGCSVHTDPAAAMDAPGVAAVLIASSGPAHEAALLEAFARGLPVLCEKPLTPDPAGTLRVMEAELRLGRRLVTVGFMRRYDSEYQELQRTLEQGELGRALMLHCRHRNAQSPPFFTTEMLIRDSVVHEADATRWLLGQEVTAVQVLRPRPSSGAPQGLGDPQLVLFETSGGVVVDVEIFVNCGFGYEVHCEAVCERGTASIGAGSGLVTRGAGRAARAIPEDFTVRFAEAYDREVRAWVDGIRRGRVEGASAWDGYAAALVCEAGVRAQECGERVGVELPERPALYA
ncbi:Inositol 2-dehydrogenase/D-chiro-inositol 3-dehydrogenase [Streptomyces hundungensis]|uniref:Inositol 2-dehydrogenase n=1 Tax=Streptomyces hundungensis TaxID=1077946 RepID=A0A387HFZ8_9ACTN|nr:Gfo/Idh/MocA family oxidoreductase [Streptomyces hundungensis]AYG82765.1 Inositol 2-dehydrogenase/D-chiro-inositol 3-dehydrogenase [Streptomyces hundungensis]